MEGPLGLEPRTRCLKGSCSNQLSYGPANVFNRSMISYIEDNGKLFVALAFHEAEDEGDDWQEPEEPQMVLLEYHGDNGIAVDSGHLAGWQ